MSYAFYPMRGPVDLGPLQLESNDVPGKGVTFARTERRPGPVSESIVPVLPAQQCYRPPVRLQAPEPVRCRSRMLNVPDLRMPGAVEALRSAILPR